MMLCDSLNGGPVSWQSCQPGRDPWLSGRAACIDKSSNHEHPYRISHVACCRVCLASLMISVILSPPSTARLRARLISSGHWDVIRGPMRGLLLQIHCQELGRISRSINWWGFRFRTRRSHVPVSDLVSNQSASDDRSKTWCCLEHRVPVNCRHFCISCNVR